MENKIDELSELEMLTDNKDTLKKMLSALYRCGVIDRELCIELTKQLNK